MCPAEKGWHFGNVGSAGRILQRPKGRQAKKSKKGGLERQLNQHLGVICRISHYWPTAKICVAWPTPLCCIAFLKLYFEHMFEAWRDALLNLLILSFPYFLTAKPLWPFVFPSWSFMENFWVWHHWDSGQTDPEPRMSKDYLKNNGN